MRCFGTQSIRGDATNAAAATERTTDVFRFAEGALFHSWEGRAEYQYGSVSVLEPDRYASGHMIFVMGQDRSSGYVSIIASTYWRIVYLLCTKGDDVQRRQ
jgi:hypothetical protein